MKNMFRVKGLGYMCLTGSQLTDEEVATLSAEFDADQPLGTNVQTECCGQHLW